VVCASAVASRKAAVAAKCDMMVVELSLGRYRSPPGLPAGAADASPHLRCCARAWLGCWLQG